MGEIGEGAGDFEDPVVGASGEVHVGHGMFEVSATLSIELAMGLHLPRCHGAVDVDTRILGETLGLDGAGLFDTAADGGRGFSLLRGG